MMEKTTAEAEKVRWQVLCQRQQEYLPVLIVAAFLTSECEKGLSA